MKILFYSDLHIRPERLQDCHKVLDTIRVLASEYEVDYVINGGDTYETRGIIPTACLDALGQHYERWHREGIRQIIMVGNHDQEDHAGQIHPMKVYRTFKDWYVVDQPTFIGPLGMAFYPYMNEGILDGVSALGPKSSEVPVDAVVHWGIQGAKRNDSNTDSDGVPVDILKNFRKVFSGHYHLRNAFENVQYIGSPMQQDFGEMGQDKGVLIYDNETEEIKFVEIEGTRKHYEVEIVSDSVPGGFEVGPVPKMRDRDAVRIKITGEVEKVSALKREDLIKMIGCEEVSFGLVQINRKIEGKYESRLNIKVEDIHDTAGLMKKYVDHVATDLDKNHLMEVGTKILEGPSVENP